MASGTASASRSSFTDWHPPSLTTPRRWQVSWAMLTQVHWPVLVVQTVLMFSEQNPVTGQFASAVHWVLLVRLHVPVGRSCVRELTQSPSQAFPNLSPSRFVCGAGLAVRTQLSCRSSVPSPSWSMLLLSHAVPWLCWPSVWDGL